MICGETAIGLVLWGKDKTRDTLSSAYMQLHHRLPFKPRNLITVR
jgi:hypothetical protein